MCIGVLPLDTPSTQSTHRGQTGGSYSRNLNHLWATGAIVLLWDTPVVEWYYPGLTEGATHLVVNAASAPEVLDKANADPEALEALRVGAQKVDDEHVCAFCLEDYFRRVFNAIRERVSYHLVLDDPATILRLAESEGACDAFYEAVVVRRVEAEGVYHDVVRRGCNLCAALRAEVRGEVCRVEGVN